MPFTMQPPPEKKPRKQFKPKPVAELQSFYTQAKIKPPPDVIKDPQVFDWSCDFWMSFDVETHDLAPKTDKKGWVQGEFGHKVRPQDTTEVRNLRVVQLGWTVGSFKPDMVPVTKVRCVKPVGFNIALAAEAVHKLSTEYVTMNGLDLKSVLEEFICDMMSTMGKSGRLCAHHFEFDAAISLLRCYFAALLSAAHLIQLEQTNSVFNAVKISISAVAWDSRAGLAGSAGYLAF